MIDSAITRRSFLTLAGSAALAVMLSSCGAKQTESAPANETKVETNTNTNANTAKTNTVNLDDEVWIWTGDGGNLTSIDGKKALDKGIDAKIKFCGAPKQGAALVFWTEATRNKAFNTIEDASVHVGVLDVATGKITKDITDNLPALGDSNPVMYNRTCNGAPWSYRNFDNDNIYRVLLNADGSVRMTFTGDSSGTCTVTVTDSKGSALFSFKTEQFDTIKLGSDWFSYADADDKGFYNICDYSGAIKARTSGETTAFFGAKLYTLNADKTITDCMTGNVVFAAADLGSDYAAYLDDVELGISGTTRPLAIVDLRHSGKSLYGVFDFEKKEWAVKPQGDYHIDVVFDDFAAISVFNNSNQCYVATMSNKKLEGLESISPKWTGGSIYVTASGKKYAYPSYQKKALEVELGTKTLTKKTSEAGTVMEGVKLTVKEGNALEESPVGK